MKIQAVPVDTNTIKLQNNSFEIYTSGGIYINYKRMFHAYFNAIPNSIEIEEIATDKFLKWVLEEYKEQIQIQHFKKQYDHNEKRNTYEDHFIFIKSGVVINLYYNSVYILFLPSEEKTALVIQEKCVQFSLKRKTKKHISFIVSHPSYGLTTKKLEIKKPKMDFETHYNSDFKEIHKTIAKNCRKKGTKGLYLFHGQPGTGKSTYIKYLIHNQTKEVIFLSPKMASNLDDINLTNFLLDNPNCILVIEDAEEIIISRDNQQNTRLSFLLNLTDGLLSESLGIQVIATFNTDLKNIDKALLRKGRLTTLYEFKPLTPQKTNTLLKKLGHQFEVDKEMTLADIYNIEKDNLYIPAIRKAVGFGV
jgi:hypothetical protein